MNVSSNLFFQPVRLILLSSLALVIGWTFSGSARAAAPAAKKPAIAAPSAAAIAALEAASKSAPDSAEAHLSLGQAYCRAKTYDKGREQLRLALRLGKGSAISQKANLALMALPKNLQNPKTGAQTRMIATMLGLGRTRGGESKPTVIDFYAAWCQPCKQLSGVIAQAKTTYGDKVSFIQVNVDDPNSQTIMDQYDVSPIPTMVFLNPEGEVVTYSVGFGGTGPVNAGIKKILPVVN